MKQVKSLILAAFLACTLTVGVQAGDMGSPGIRCENPGDMGSPGAVPPPPCNPNDPPPAPEPVDPTEPIEPIIIIYVKDSVVSGIASALSILF
jgi:hypothetical protein